MTIPRDWLTAAEARLAASTPGPWHTRENVPGLLNVNMSDGTLASVSVWRSGVQGATGESAADAAFIAAAPTDLRRALAVCRAAERRVKWGHSPDCEIYTPFSVGIPCDCGYAELRAALDGEEVQHG